MSDPKPRRTALLRLYRQVEQRKRRRKWFRAHAGDLLAMGMPAAEVLRNARDLGITIREAFEERP